MDWIRRSMVGRDSYIKRDLPFANAQGSFDISRCARYKVDRGGDKIGMKDA